MSSGQNFIKHIQKVLPVSGKNTKLIAQLTSYLGVEAAYALISQLGIGEKKGKASKDEILLIAYMLESFKPLKIESYDVVNKPLSVILKGVGPEGSIVRVYPQFRVPQNGFDGKNLDWSIDVLLKCFKVMNGEELEVSGIALEYDGHDAHFRDHNIERSYLRDMSIKQETRFTTLHVTKEAWRNKKSTIRMAIVRAFCLEIEHFLSVYRKAFAQGVKSATNTYSHSYLSIPDTIELPKLTVCPKCNGNCEFENISCDFCNGMGSVKEHVGEAYDSETQGFIDCPLCSSSSNLDCVKCGGVGRIRVNA
ncbi:hypothetical protein [Vibrio sp. Vb2658]|uniref:hypothetical protein n=1 Tax=Vibrio sp. Vb2658 TaxID=3074672 RepID=UPI0028085D39|nr:hypothetical protein [Vibrio sp. Vb2658]ELA7834301.1 hypothetical protein [Vibrio alginolyticus]MDW1661210.1 hypothetical protein [Vibrio sp. Vb2658]